MSGSIFYHNVNLNKLIPYREYYTLLAKNMLSSHYSLIEIIDTKEYAGTFIDHCIYGFGDNRCGFYTFDKNGEKNVIRDNYHGHRAFCLYREIPDRWLDCNVEKYLNIYIEKYLICRANNIINVLISLSSYIRCNKKTNIICSTIILSYFDFPRRIIPEIYKLVENIVFFKKLSLV
jgi:hypothetical protein